MDDSHDATPVPDGEKARRTGVAKGNGRAGPTKANVSGPMRKVLDVDVLIEELLSVSTNAGEFVSKKINGCLPFSRQLSVSTLLCTVAMNVRGSSPFLGSLSQMRKRELLAHHFAVIHWRCTLPDGE